MRDLEQEKETTDMAKRLMVLIGMLAMLFAAAIPAFAQQGQVTATGYLSPVYPQDVYTHLLNDEATGASYLVRSEVVDLDSYDDGQRVTVSGTLVNDERYPEPILEVSQAELADGGPGETVTLTFELTVEGEPPADATFLGTIRAEGLGTVPLTDPDGDGVYVGSRELSKYPPGLRPLPPDAEPVSLPVQIVQGPATRNTALGPEFRVIKDFGEVKLDGDKTLAASISFEDGGGSIGVDVNEDGSVDEADGEAAAEISDSAMKEARASGEPTLPVTGGAELSSLSAGLAGLFLVISSLLARHASR